MSNDFNKVTRRITHQNWKKDRTRQNRVTSLRACACTPSTCSYKRGYSKTALRCLAYHALSSTKTKANVTPSTTRIMTTHLQTQPFACACARWMLAHPSIGKDTGVVINTLKPKMTNVQNMI